MRAEPPASLVDWGVLAAVHVLLAMGVASLLPATAVTSLFPATPGTAWADIAHAAAAAPSG